MKILFVNPPIRVWSKPNCLPLGIAFISAVLRNAGHEVEVLDINAHRYSPSEVEERIKKADYDLVGIGGIVTIYKYVKWIIPILKKYHPNKKIIIGGSVGTSIPEIMLRNNDADIVCLGEGEVTTLEVVKALEEKRDLSGVEGIWYKADDGHIYQTKMREPIKDLSVLPSPAWDLFPVEIYIKNPVGAPNRNKWLDGGFQNDEEAVLSMNLHATRGCPYKCIYCYHDFMGIRWRHRLPEAVVSEMKFMYDKYNVTYFQIPDDLFCVDKDFVYTFCREVKRELKREVTWGVDGRVNLMTEEMIATMADAGCIEIAYGIESGSQKMLDIMKKQVTVEQAKRAIELTFKYGTEPRYSLLIGLPGETRQTIQETVDFCKSAAFTPEVIFFATAYPATELYRYALAQGMIKNEEEYILGLGEQGEKIRLSFTDIPDEELYEIHSRMIEELRAWNKHKELHQKELKR